MIGWTAAIIITASCNEQQAARENLATPRTPVEVTHIRHGSISNRLTLFGTTLYLKRNVVTSPIPAFINDVHIKLGDRIRKGDVLYDLETKERRALGQHYLGSDSTLSLFGRIKVVAPFAGIISTLDKQQLGDYVLEGTQLCTIAESSNLAIQVNVPYEYTSFVKVGNVCTLRLPGGEEVIARITTPLTTMNVLAQTQSILAKPVSNLFLPENLIVKVDLATNRQKNVPLLPKSSVLTDEMMRTFWIMKMLDDSTAIKVPVKIGEKSKEEIEILSPSFSEADRILISGGYGLPDTARVIINP